MMADEIDQAQEQIEQHLAFALKSRKRETLRPIGSCRFCEDAIEAGLLFCSADCRDDWDRVKRARERSGTKDL
jgi:predicted nucleic acid-binding Zn ribbon protein